MDVLSSATEMAKKRRARASQAHPTGPLETVDDAWRNEVRARMLDEGMDQADLAAAIQASEGAVSGMLREGAPRQVRLKGRVEHVLRMQPKGKLEEIHRRISAKWHRLSPDDAALVDQLVDSLARKRQSGT